MVGGLSAKGATAQQIGDVTGSVNSSIVFSDYQASLAPGEKISSGYIDMGQVDKLQFSGNASLSGMTMRQISRSNDLETPVITSSQYTAGTFFLFSLPVRQRYMQIERENTTGSTVTNVSMEVKVTYGSSDKLSVFPLAVQPAVFSQAALTQSVVIGQDESGIYKSVKTNQAGAMLTSEFGVEVARGLYNGYEIDTKFGRNPEIDTATVPEDLRNGGSLYTGFNATAGENVSISSASANDVGALMDSGTATGGSETTLVDTTKNFVATVAIGDLVINDTKGIHGTVTSVTATTLTVFKMFDGPGESKTNESGNTYRIARATGTGAGVVRLSSVLDGGFNKATPIYIIMNGTTTVTTTGKSVRRCPRVRVVKAGSLGLNAGVMTLRQAVTTANIFAIVPTFGQSTIGALTVPKGKTMIIKRVRCAMTRANGSAGSATVVLNTREFGGAWNGARVFEIQDAGPVEYTNVGGIVLQEATDVKFTISSVSDNDTVVDGSMEYYLIDNT